MFTIDFWKDAAERAIKTAAQSVILFWGVGDAMFNAFEMDWQGALGIALGGLVISLLTSLVSAPFTTKGTASLTSEVQYKQAA